ncbi:MAG TPA: hypothetical protein VG963_21205, partial [Polyangiaceae bacterium]|nr:hypothetical protein [Polyangiaceae bacterium]
VLALPLDLVERLPSWALYKGADAAYLRSLLEERGVRRDVARTWPQRLGFSIVKKLAERGRIAYALASNSRSRKRLARERNWGSVTVRVPPEKLLASLRAAGQPIASTRRRVR